MKTPRKMPLSSSRSRVQQLLKKSPSPSDAEANFGRLLESGGSQSIDKIPLNELPVLTRLLGGSAYLSEVLIQQGRNLPELFLVQIKIQRKTVDDHLRELKAVTTVAQSLDEFCAGLRRHKQREYLRIGVRDLDPSVAMEETVRELTALAEASLESAYLYCRREVEQGFGYLRLPGTERPNAFLVLGMGKLGGSELNFSSDVDVIFLYENDEGESSGGRRGKVEPRAFFAEIGKKIIQAMGKVTEDGFVFRIDLRLRPLGVNGPLVQSIDSAMLYYESWGQSWERAALIKARPVAGDRNLGNRFLKEIEPFVYRRYLDYTTVEELRHMKTRIENELLSPKDKERNIKIGYGGEGEDWV